MAGRPWARADDATVEFFWSSESNASIGERLGRTAVAVRKRARALGLRPARSYHRTFDRACVELGYHEATVRRAVHALHLHLERLGSYEPRTDAQRRAAKRIPTARAPKTGPRVALGQAPLVVSDVQFAKLRAYLLAAPPPRPCAGCTRTDVPVWRHGYCEACRWRLERGPRQRARASLLGVLAARAATVALTAPPPWSPRVRTNARALLSAGPTVFIAWCARRWRGTARWWYRAFLTGLRTMRRREAAHARAA